MSIFTPSRIPLSLYIHFPWCIRKCPYCDFNSHTLKEALPESQYIQALLTDLRHELKQCHTARPLTSIFLGGGTPSLFSAKSLKTLLSSINNEIDFSEDIEITLEANPGTIEHDNFAGYRQAGINRISLGAQSFNDAILHKIGRIHKAEDTYYAVEKLSYAGFDNFNLDLMFAQPGQTLGQAIDDLEQAISLNPTHLSLYQFTLEPNTYFSKYPPKLPNSQSAFDMQQMLINNSQAKGFSRYEISAYSQPGKTCKHNLNYWQFGDYLGIGAGAHGKITHPDKIIRHQKIRHPAHYLKKSSEPDKLRLVNELPKKDILFEMMMNVLRLKNGISIEKASTHSSLTELEIMAAINPLIQDQLITTENKHFYCTEKGYLFLDSILTHFLTE